MDSRFLFTVARFYIYIIMTIHDAQRKLIFQLYDIYDNREAGNIADLVMEYVTGWKKIDRILNKQVPLLKDTIDLLEKFTADLLAHKPVQYVLHEAWFFGLKLFVNEHVLIPRPETEELVDWIVTSVGSLALTVGNNAAFDKTALDIGTGSGCISVALKKQLPALNMVACDVSKDALEVAQKNSLDHQADIAFLHLNFLDREQWNLLPTFDIIVSNPPYVPLKDMEAMQPNVLRYEPHLALFVENDDPLIFYKAIAEFAKEKLNPGGYIFAEINETLAGDVQAMFEKNKFSSFELKKDMQGKERMIRVSK